MRRLGVGMNVHAAARYRALAFDGAVSLGPRSNTPTLHWSPGARRRSRVKAEPYWLRGCAVRGGPPERRYQGAITLAASRVRRDEAATIVEAVKGKGRRDHQAREEGGARRIRSSSTTRLTPSLHATATRASLLARRTLAAGRISMRSTRRSRTRLPARASCRATKIRGRSSDAELRGSTPVTRRTADYVLSRSTTCRSGSSWTTKRSTDHHALIPTKS